MKLKCFIGNAALNLSFSCSNTPAVEDKIDFVCLTQSRGKH